MEDEHEIEAVYRQNSSLAGSGSRKRGGTTDSNQRFRFHLRRIGQQATKSDVADIMDFDKVTSLIGRNRDQVDFVLDSSNPVASQYISRLHARVVRQGRNAHRLFDDSLNGIFINNTKIQGSVILQEGDIVTFGHPYGMKLAAGVWKRQPDSEHQFIFERCTCLTEPPVKMTKSMVLEDRINIHNTEQQPAPKAKLARADSQDVDAVLSATRILDSCISKISGLAQSLRESPTACKRSADLITDVQHDVSTTSHQSGIGTCAKKTLFPISAQTPTAIIENLSSYTSMCNDTVVADISVCTKSQDDHLCGSSTVDGKNSKSPAPGNKCPESGKNSKDLASGQDILPNDYEQLQSVVPPQQHSLSQSKIDHFISEPPLPSLTHEKATMIHNRRDLKNESGLTELVITPVSSDCPQLFSAPSENVAQLDRICVSDASDTDRTDKSTPGQDAGKVSDLQDSQDNKGVNQVGHISVVAAGEQTASTETSESCQQTLLTNVHSAAAGVSVKDENILTKNISDQEHDLLGKSEVAQDLSDEKTVTAKMPSVQQQTEDPQLMSDIVPGDTNSQTDVTSSVCNSSLRQGGCADSSEDVHVSQEDNLAPPAHTKSHDASSSADQQCQISQSNNRLDTGKVKGQTENDTLESPSIVALPRSDSSQCERDTIHITEPHGESTSNLDDHLSDLVLPDLVLISSPSCSKSKFFPSTSDTPQAGCQIETELSLQSAELSQSHCQPPIVVTQMEETDAGLKQSSSNVDVCLDASETVPATKVNCETNSLNISAEVVKGICEDFLEDDSGESSLRCADVQSVLARLTESQPEDEQEGGLSTSTASDREITHICDVSVARSSDSGRPDTISDKNDRDDLSLDTLTKQTYKANPDSENPAEASKVTSNDDAEVGDGEFARRSSCPADVVICVDLSEEQTLPVGLDSQLGVEWSVSSAPAQSDVQFSTTTTAATAHRAENSRVGVSLTFDPQDQQPFCVDRLGGQPVGVQNQSEKSDHMTYMAKQQVKHTGLNVLHHLESEHERQEDGEEFGESFQTVRSNYACVCGSGGQAEEQERHQTEREEFDTMLQIVRANYACGSEVKRPSEESLTTSRCGSDYPAMPSVISLISHSAVVSQSGHEISTEVNNKLYEVGDLAGSTANMTQSLSNADHKSLLKNGESELQISSGATVNKQCIGMSCGDVSSETAMSQLADGDRNIENSSVTQIEDGSMEMGSCKIHHSQDTLMDVAEDSISEIHKETSSSPEVSVCQARTVRRDCSPAHSAVEDVTVSPLQDTVTASSLDLFESSPTDVQETEVGTGQSGTGQVGERDDSERPLTVTGLMESTEVWSGLSSQQQLLQGSERGHQPMLKTETDAGVISQSFTTSTPTEEAGEAPAWNSVGNLMSPVSVQASPKSQGSVVPADNHRELTTARGEAVTLTLPVPHVDVSLNVSQTDEATLTEQTEAKMSTLFVPQDVLPTDNSVARERNLQPKKIDVRQDQCMGVSAENKGRILSAECSEGKAQQEENGSGCQTACNITAAGSLEWVTESCAGGDELEREQEQLSSLRASVEDVSDADMDPCDSTSLESGQETVGRWYRAGTLASHSLDTTSQGEEDLRECVAPAAAQPRPEMLSDVVDVRVTDQEISVDVQKDSGVKTYLDSNVSQSEFAKSDDAYNNYGEVQNVVKSGGQVKVIPSAACADRENEIGGDEKCLMSSEETEALRMWEQQVQSAISRQLNSDVGINTTGGVGNESWLTIDKTFCAEKLQDFSVTQDVTSATTDRQCVGHIVSSHDSTRVTGEHSSAVDGGRSSHIMLGTVSSSENVDEVLRGDLRQGSSQAGSQSDVTAVSRDTGGTFSTPCVREVRQDQDMAENEIAENFGHDLSHSPTEDDAHCEILEPTENSQLEQRSSTVQWENSRTSEISQANLEVSWSAGEGGQAVQEDGQAGQEDSQAGQEDGPARQEDGQARQEGQVKQGDGQARQEDGQDGQKDGQVKQEDGQAGQEDGQVRQEDGQVRQEDGQIRQENDQVRQEDGQAVQEDGQAVQEDGQVRQEDGQVRREDGPARQEDGQVKQEDGQAGQENGQVRQEDGQAGQENGQVRREDGPARQENGQVRQEDGQAGQENGQVRQEDGQAGQENGQVRREDGPARQEDGQVRQEDGQAGQENGQVRQEDGQAEDEDGQYAHGQENRQDEFLGTFGLCPNLTTECPRPVPVSSSSPQPGVREGGYLHLNIIARPSDCSPVQKCLLDSPGDIAPDTIISYEGPDVLSERHSNNTEFFKVPPTPQRESTVTNSQVDGDGCLQGTLENLSDGQRVSGNVAVEIQNEQSAGPDDNGVPKMLETFQSTISQSGRAGGETRTADFDTRSAGEDDKTGVEESPMGQGEANDDIQSVASQLSEFRDEEDLHLVLSQFDISADRASSLGEDMDFNTSFSVPEGDGQEEKVGEGMAEVEIGSGDSQAVTYTANSHGTDHMNSQAQTDIADSGASEPTNSQAGTEMADSDVSERNDHMDSQAATDTADSDVSDSVNSQAVTEMTDSDVKEQEKHADFQDSQAATDTADSDVNDSVNSQAVTEMANSDVKEQEKHGDSQGSQAVTDTGDSDDCEPVDSQALTDITDSDQEQMCSSRTSCTSGQSAAVHRNDGIEFGDDLSDESLTDLSECESEERSRAQADLPCSGAQHFEEMSGTTDSHVCLAESVEPETVTTTERLSELSAEESSDIGEKVREGETTSGHLAATRSLEISGENVNTSGDHMTSDTSLDVVSVSNTDVIKGTTELMDRQIGVGEYARQTDGQVAWQEHGNGEEVAALTSPVIGVCSASDLNLSLGFDTLPGGSNVMGDPCEIETGSNHHRHAQFALDPGENSVNIPQSKSVEIKVTGDSDDDVSERSDTDSHSHAENTDTSWVYDFGHKTMNQTGLVVDDSTVRVGSSGRGDIGQDTDAAVSESSDKADQCHCVQCVSNSAAGHAKVFTGDREAETAETSSVMGKDVSVELSASIDSEIWNRQEMSEVSHSDVKLDGEISEDINISMTSDLPSSQGFDVASCSGNRSGSERENSWCEEVGEPWRESESDVSQVRTDPVTGDVSSVNKTNVCDKNQIPGSKSDDVGTGEMSLKPQACPCEGVSGMENVCSEVTDSVMEDPAGGLSETLTDNNCASVRVKTNHMNSNMVSANDETQSVVCDENQSFVRCEPGVDLVKARCHDMDETKSETEHQGLQNSSKVDHGRDLKRKSNEISENVEKRCRYSSDSSVAAEKDIHMTHSSPVSGLPAKKFLHPLRSSEGNLTANKDLTGDNQDVTDRSFKIVHLQVDRLCEDKAGKNENQLSNSVSCDNGPCASTFTENGLTCSQAERHSTQTEKSRTSQEREAQPSRNGSSHTPITSGKLTMVPVINPTIQGEVIHVSPHTKVLHLMAQPVWRPRHDSHVAAQANCEIRTENFSTSQHYSSSSPRTSKDIWPTTVISPSDDGTSHPPHTPKQSIDTDVAVILNPHNQTTKNFAATAGNLPQPSLPIPPTQTLLSPTHTDLASRTSPTSSPPSSGKSVTSSAVLSHHSVTSTAASTSQHMPSLADTPDSQRTRRREQLQAAVLAELVRLNKEIRTSLKIGNPNLEQAIAALEDLDMLPINPAVLEQCPTIVDTVKKCQKYGYCESVRAIARRIYSRFQAVLGSDTEK